MTRANDCPYTEAELAQRKAALRADLARYAETGGPSNDELRRAPLLDGYRIAAVEGVALATGWCVGHPRLRPGLITTAEVVRTGDGWLRTTGRLYRLGERLELDPEVGPSPDDILDADDHACRLGR